MATLYDRDDGLHVSSYPFRGQLVHRSRVHKRALLLTCRDVYPVSAYMLAVITVQRYWRGVLLRRRVLRHYLQGNFRRGWQQDEALVQRVYRLTPRAPERDLVKLVTAVQARWRTVLLRAEFSRWSTYDTWPLYYVAAATIQRAWVDYQFASKQKRHKHRAKRFFLSREHAMAGRIQQAWRCFVDRQVFTFYRRVVAYRQGGDPQLMLRAINPSEAYLMDPAAGLHVRFRLAGPCFPPVVVYKIYTHRAVADICAFAPKDYTRVRDRQAPVSVHNKPQRAGSVPAAGRRDGWYQRVENNDWRAVSEGAFMGGTSSSGADMPELPPELLTMAEQRFARFLAPPAASASASRGGGSGAVASWRSRRPKKFLATAVKRREDNARRAKETRRRWLVELYAAEQENHNRAPRETLRREAEALFATLSDEDVDEETRRLVEWTQHLDFEAYRSEWQRTATTAPTDAVVVPV